MAKGPLGNNWEHYNGIIGVKIQKKERPKIETIIELLVSDPVLKGNLNEIVELLKENGAKPSWFTTSHYKFKHSKEISFQIKLGDGFKFRENEIYITIHTAKPQKINQFKQLLPNKLSDLIPADSAKWHVCKDSNPCKNRADFVYEGKQYNNICAKNIEVNFPIDSNSTNNHTEQFQTIQDLIRVKAKYNIKEK